MIFITCISFVFLVSSVSDTLPAISSSPLKIGRAPKGLSSSNHQFSGAMSAMLVLLGVYHVYIICILDVITCFIYTRVIILPTQTMHYGGKIHQNHHRCVFFESPQIDPNRLNRKFNHPCYIYIHWRQRRHPTPPTASSPTTLRQPSSGNCCETL